MSTLQIETPRAYRPLLEPARYKAAWGGRGGAKSNFFCELLVEDCLNERGMLAVCIREHQKDLKHSSKLLIEKKIRTMGVSQNFRTYSDRIQTPGDGVIIFQGMQDHTAESIKSLEGFKRALVEEAQTMSERSLTMLRPTIREEGSQIWAAWNPRRKSDAIDKFLRQTPPTNSIVVRANWYDNPWFPSVLEEERQTDLKLYPDRYDHIWEGGYVKALEGAYYAKELALAKSSGRICRLTPDPILPIRAFWDIGGSGAKADAMAIWITQWVKRDILVLDYIEGQGQVLAYYVNELRQRGWGDALCTLPHDGVNSNAITGKRYEDHVREAGFKVDVIPNQGPGAAMMRVEAARRLFPQIMFNDGPVRSTGGIVLTENATEPGRDALGYYHEKKDHHRQVGMGPEHDWSSNAADAFGLMCVAYEVPKLKATTTARPVQLGAGSNSWMGS